MVNTIIEPDGISYNILEIQHLLPPPYDEFFLKVNLKASKVQGLKCIGVLGELGYQLLELLGVGGC